MEKDMKAARSAALSGLLLALAAECTLKIGRAGTMRFAAGGYCYVGSALGAGGLAARLRRHASAGRPRHWHIDYLLPDTRLIGALVADDATRHECTWAAWVFRHPGSTALTGFGASDCGCPAHLFHIGSDLDDPRFARAAQKALAVRFVPAARFTPGRGQASAFC